MIFFFKVKILSRSLAEEIALLKIFVLFHLIPKGQVKPSKEREGDFINVLLVSKFFKQHHWHFEF